MWLMNALTRFVQIVEFKETIWLETVRILLFALIVGRLAICGEIVEITGAHSRLTTWNTWNRYGWPKKNVCSRELAELKPL